ncbi:MULTISPECIES: hypothetical protein [unclassified Corynebacterium]|uniref:hypothetical protein n=1 Tax=unclassified Corynebacterium TaxID=2624378 RepID=UPI003525095A
MSDTLSNGSVSGEPASEPHRDSTEDLGRTLRSRSVTTATILFIVLVLVAVFLAWRLLGGVFGESGKDTGGGVLNGVPTVTPQDRAEPLTIMTPDGETVMTDAYAARLTGTDYPDGFDGVAWTEGGVARASCAPGTTAAFAGRSDDGDYVTVCLEPESGVLTYNGFVGGGEYAAPVDVAASDPDALYFRVPAAESLIHVHWDRLDVTKGSELVASTPVTVSFSALR